MEIHQELIELIRRADRTGADRLLGAWAEAYGYERLVADVLDPVLQQMGKEWQTGSSITLSQAYVAAKITEDVFSKVLANRRDAFEGQTKGHAVIGNIEDDFHSLGRRMVGTFLSADGWIVHDLGNDVPPSRFVDTAESTGARIIGVSAMTLSTARNIRRLRDEIDRRGLRERIKLAVGGAIFIARPDMVLEVGGDGTAVNALKAGELFESLLLKATGEPR